MTLNSSFDILTEQAVSSSSLLSSSPANESAKRWIQPPISSQAHRLDSSVIIDGIYAQVKPLGVIPLVKSELELELEAWEIASDETLRAFEAQLD